MTIPRFTLLQLLGAMTVCGVLFCIAAIDPVGSAVALGILVLCAVVAMFVGAVVYLVTRVTAEMVYVVFGRPTQQSPFASLTPAPQPAATPAPDLASTVESLQSETARELGAPIIDATTTDEEPPA